MRGLARGSRCRCVSARAVVRTASILCVGTLARAGDEQQHCRTAEHDGADLEPDDLHARPRHGGERGEREQHPGETRKTQSRVLALPCTAVTATISPAPHLLKASASHSWV